MDYYWKWSKFLFFMCDCVLCTSVPCDLWSSVLFMHSIPMWSSLNNVCLSACRLSYFRSSFIYSMSVFMYVNVWMCLFCVCVRVILCMCVLMCVCVWSLFVSSMSVFMCLIFCICLRYIFSPSFLNLRRLQKRRFIRNWVNIFDWKCPANFHLT